MNPEELKQLAQGLKLIAAFGVNDFAKEKISAFEKEMDVIRQRAILDINKHAEKMGVLQSKVERKLLDGMSLLIAQRLNLCFDSCIAKVEGDEIVIRLPIPKKQPSPTPERE